MPLSLFPPSLPPPPPLPPPLGRMIAGRSSSRCIATSACAGASCTRSAQCATSPRPVPAPAPAPVLPPLACRCSRRFVLMRRLHTALRPWRDTTRIPSLPRPQAMHAPCAPKRGMLQRALACCSAHRPLALSHRMVTLPPLRAMVAALSRRLAGLCARRAHPPADPLQPAAQQASAAPQPAQPQPRSQPQSRGGARPRTAPACDGASGTVPPSSPAASGKRPGLGALAEQECKREDAAEPADELRQQRWATRSASATAAAK